jgi:DNA-binding MarR family transcriptional regulator
MAPGPRDRVLSIIAHAAQAPCRRGRLSSHVRRHIHTVVPADPTARQGQFLAFIYWYSKVNRRPPAEADIQRYFGVTPPTVHQMVLTLEKAGLLQRSPGQARSLKVLLPVERLPFLE